MQEPLPPSDFWKWHPFIQPFFPTGCVEVGRCTLALIIASFVVSALCGFSAQPGLIDSFTITG